MKVKIKNITLKKMEEICDSQSDSHEEVSQYSVIGIGKCLHCPLRINNSIEPAVYCAKNIKTIIQGFNREIELKK